MNLKKVVINKMMIMKKCMLVLCILGFLNVAYGQTNTFPPSGNVGIGTVSPILGSLTIAAPDKNTLSAIAIRQNNNTAFGFDFGLDQAVDGCGYLFAINGIKKVGLMRFDRNNYTVTFNGGNVGIGTDTPREKLSVNGKIRAHEIKVETANWPDYVFAKDYQLPSLKETEKHILEKGHLEGIPSAEEVKSNGINVGEMNAKLLQKIEELTLLMIQLNKKVEQQSATIERQEGKLQQFQDQMKSLNNKKDAN